LAAHAKEGFSFVAEGPLAHGFRVAVAGYTLAPEATMDGIVREARTALRWLHQRLATLGGDPARLYVSGWSAGGHLAAMLMDEPLVAGGLAISGLFDLEPIRLCYLNEKLGLDANRRGVTARC
jgi:arylformamidase